VEATKKINRARAKTRRWQLRGGRPPKDDRIVVTAIWYVLRTGCPWRDVPERYGPWGSIYTRWRRWCASGLWPRLLQRLARRARGALRHLDCSHIKLHQDGANPPGGQAAQAIGRTKGGLNTKLAAVVDRHGRAVAVCLAPGPHHDLHAVEPLLPAVRQQRLVADKGFDADSFRERLRHQHTQCCIPPRRGRHQPARFHRGYYRCRHHVENFFARIKKYRRVGTRYDKLAATFLAFVLFAAVLDWLTHEV
jgi:transposase